MTVRTWIKIALKNGATLKELTGTATACGVPTINLYETIIEMQRMNQIEYKGEVMYSR
jgi:hypothetical protein